MAAPIKVNLLLPEIDFGSKNFKLRHMWIRDRKHICLDNVDEKDTLLYLGTDILAPSTIPSKNHPRIHARYAKEGLAAKVVLEGAKVEGIHNCQSLWCYNMQGLFKIVFEYLDAQYQGFCLTHLTECWMTQSRHAALPNTIVLAVPSDKGTATPTSAVDVPIGTLVSPREDVAVAPSISLNPETCPLVPNLSERREAGEAILRETGAQGPCPTSHAATRPVYRISNACTSPASKVDDCAEDTKPRPVSLNVIVRETLHGVQRLLSTAEETADERDGHVTSTDVRACRALKICLEFIEIEYLNGAERCGSRQRVSGFPIDLLRQYTTMLKDSVAERLPAEAAGGAPRNQYWDDPGYDMPMNQYSDTGMHTRKSLALCVLSQWLGLQYKLMRDKVEKRVQDFKAEHIKCIDNLPPSQEIVNSVFPKCMVLFLTKWLGSSDSSHTVGSSVEPATKLSKLNDSEDESLFPLMQLILEFANNALISGVAHVVYSRVMQSV